MATVRELTTRQLVDKKYNETLAAQRAYTAKAKSDFLPNEIERIELDQPNYVIYNHYDTDKLTQIVNEIIPLGYLPAGGVTKDGKGNYYQAMMKEKPVVCITSNLKRIKGFSDLKEIRGTAGGNKTRGKKIKTRKTKKSRRHRRH